MAKGSLSEEMALRIGLAARTLPDSDPARLLAVLSDTVGLPPTPERLAALSLQQLRQGAGAELGDVDEQSLLAALALLQGVAGVPLDPPPPVVPYQDGEMPESIRVACASNGGDALDGHFGAARCFLIYQVSAADLRLIDVREVDEALSGDDRNAHRAALIADCQLLYVASIGGPAAAKVVKHGIHPLKDSSGGSATERLRDLQRILAGKPPPWLAKIMGSTPEERVRFAQESLEA